MDCRLSRCTQKFSTGRDDGAAVGGAADRNVRADGGAAGARGLTEACRPKQAERGRAGVRTGDAIIGGGRTDSDAAHTGPRAVVRDARAEASAARAFTAAVGRRIRSDESKAAAAAYPAAIQSG